MRRLAGAFTAIACAFLPLSCGGSGGGGGGGGSPPYVFTAALFAGPYHAVTIGGEKGPPEEGVTSWGTLTSDGVDVLAPTGFAQNDNRTVGPPGILINYHYTVSGAGDLQLTLSGPAARGGLAREGLAAAVASANPLATRSAALFLLQKASGLATSTLTGAYHVGYLSPDAVAGVHLAVLGGATLDGAGNGSLAPSLRNSGGTITAGGIPATVTYAVAADGAVTTAGDLALAGGVLPGGQVALLAGSTTNGQAPGVMMLVKKSAGESAATLSGTYTFVGLDYVVLNGSYESVFGTFTADGSGGFVLVATVQSDGAQITIGPVSGTYTVAPDGAVTAAVGSLAIAGGVSDDGQFAFLGGGTAAGSNPALFVLIRR